MENFVIRKGTKEDTPVIVDFSNRLAWETEDKKLDLDLVTKGVNHAFDYPKWANYFVVEDKGKVVGMLMVTHEMSAMLGGRIDWIQSVYVLAEYRKKGVFRQLYQHVYNTAKKDPVVKAVRLYVETTNEVAMKVYEKMGMKNIADDYNFNETDFYA